MNRFGLSVRGLFMEKMVDQLVISAVHSDNRNNHLLESSTGHADVLKYFPCGTKRDDDGRSCWMAGIDEAGRGPVLGPMVYCICAVPMSEEATQFLKASGCADSKVLSEKQRESAFARMCDKVVWVAKVLSPVYLSREMLRPTKVSLNAISHDAARELTEIVSAQLQKNRSVLTKLFVDTVGPPEKYQQKLKEFFPEMDVTVSKKADSLFVAVSAASIIAKLIRDKVLKTWRFEELNMPLASVPAFQPPLKRPACEIDVGEDHIRPGTPEDDGRKFKRHRSTFAGVAASGSFGADELPTLRDSADAGDVNDDDMPAVDDPTLSLSYGSGYPGDPKTKRFLAANCDPVFGFSRLVRFSWQTAQTLMSNSKGGAVLSWPDDLPEDQSWKPPSNLQAGAMDKFVSKKKAQPAGEKKLSVWRDAAHYREMQLNLVSWPV